jgi:hypothetical protein
MSQIEMRAGAPAAVDPAGAAAGRRVAGLVQGRDPWLFVVMGVGALLAVWFCRRGPALSPDSMNYLSAAASLRSGHYQQVDGAPMSVFPPGLPALLALGELVGLSGQAAGAVLVVASYAVLAAATFLLVRRATRSRIAGALCALAGLAMPSTQRVAQWVWSEPLYLALSVVILVLAVQLRSDPDGVARAAGLGGCVAAAFLVRYEGFMWAAVAVVVVVRPMALARRDPVEWKRLGLLVVTMAVAPVLWVLRDVVVTGQPLGPRPRATASVSDLLGQERHTVMLWFDPQAWVSSPVHVTIALILGFLILLGAVLTPRVERIAILATLLALVAFLVVITESSHKTATDPLDFRLMAPAAPLLVVTLVLGVHAGLRRLPRLPRLATGTLAAVGVLALVGVDFEAVPPPPGSGAGVPVDTGVRAWVASRPAACERYLSNNPHVMYRATGMRVPVTPAIHEHQSLDVNLAPRQALVAAAQRPGTCVIQFEKADIERFSADQLRALVDLVPVAQVGSDGVFLARPRSGA